MSTEAVKYDGPYEEIELVLPDGGEITVKQGESVDVPSEVAKNLLAQETWKKGRASSHDKKED